MFFFGPATATWHKNDDDQVKTETAFTVITMDAIVERRPNDVGFSVAQKLPVNSPTTVTVETRRKTMVLPPSCR